MTPQTQHGKAARRTLGEDRARLTHGRMIKRQVRT